MKTSSCLQYITVVFLYKIKYLTNAGTKSRKIFYIFLKWQTTRHHIKGILLNQTAAIIGLKVIALI